MAKLHADFSACQGYGNCVVAAPDAYDIDDDGTVVLLLDDVDESDRPRIESAAKSCPVSALTVSSS